MGLDGERWEKIQKDTERYEKIGIDAKRWEKMGIDGSGSETWKATETIALE